MTSYASPYENINPEDPVLVAQAQAFELAVAANSGESVDPEVVVSASFTASELAMAANIGLLRNHESSVI